MELRISDSREDLARSFSEYFSESVRNNTVFHVALSGGSTPKVIFEDWAKNYKDVISWEKVRFYWGDERCVAPDHKESNYKMTKDHLLTGIDIPDDNIHRIKGENDPTEEALVYGALLQEKLPKSNGIPQFNMVILGMGDDGHTASIFPHEIDLWHSPEYCVVAKHPETGQRRVTITGQMINNASQVVFLVTGQKKAQKVREILKKDGHYHDYPASLVSPRSGVLIWFLDQEAAEEL